MINTMYFLFKLFFEIYKYFCCALFKLMNNEEIPKRKKVEIYVEKELKRYRESFEKEKNMNSSIVKEIYDKKLFKELLSDPNNLEEKKWKSRILYKNGYREDDKEIGVIMYYDLYRQGFVYYSNDNVISYRVLNAIAMDYVLKYFCRDFFMDEKLLEELNKSEEKLELKSIFYEEEKKEKKEDEEKEEKDNRDVFAKLKNYKKEEKTKTGEKKKEYLKNKFIRGGKIYEFNILKKCKNESNIETSYDAMFKSEKISYKDYKNLKNNTKA